MWISGAVSGPPASSSSDLDVGILAQPRREHAARRAGTDDHVVSRHRYHLGSKCQRSLTRLACGRTNCARVRLPRDGRDDLLGLYWTISGPVEVHVGREWSLFDLRDRCEQAARVGFERHRALARRPRARARDTLARRGQAAPRRQRPRVPRARVPDGLVPRPGRRAPRASDRIRALLFEAAAALDAHHVKVGNIPGTPCELPAADRALRRALRRRRGAARREGGLRVHAVRRERPRPRLGAGGRRGRRRAERRPRDRHVAHGEARDRARRAAPHPVAPPRLGRAQRRPLREHARPRSTRPSTTAGSPARASSRSATTSPPAARSATTARGASRCSRRSCATCRSTEIFDRAYETSMRAARPRARKEPGA